MNETGGSGIDTVQSSRSINLWFFDTADVPIAVSLLAIAAFTGLCLAAVWWTFRIGWRLRQ